MLTLAPPNDAQYTYSLGAIRTSAIPATIHVCFVAAAAAAAEQPAAAAAAAAVAACCRCSGRCWLYDVLHRCRSRPALHVGGLDRRSTHARTFSGLAD